MKKYYIKIVTLILCAVLFLITLGLSIFTFKADRQSENTTAYYQATIKSVEIVESSDVKYAQIYTDQYRTVLYITSNIYDSIDKSCLKTLTEGEAIYFRINNEKSKQFNKVEFLDIVSLKTDDAEIFSLDDYNFYVSKSIFPARLLCIVLSAVFLLMFVLLIITIKAK